MITPHASTATWDLVTRLREEAVPPSFKRVKKLISKAIGVGHAHNPGVVPVKRVLQV